MTMNGSDHARMRREMRFALSRSFFEQHIDEAVETAREQLRSWPIGKRLHGRDFIRHVFMEQSSRLLAGRTIGERIQDFEDVFQTLMIKGSFKEFGRLYARRLRKAWEKVDLLKSQILFDHQDSKHNRHSDIIDDLLEAHHNDPVFMSERRLEANSLVPYFAVVDTVGNIGAFMVYYVLKHPDILEKVRAEADQVFANGVPTADSLRNLDVTHRVAMETMRLCPVAPAVSREVTTSFDIGGYRIPVGTDTIIGYGCTHYLSEFFPDPDRFDIDRYLPDRNEHRQPGIYVPFGLGLHRCLGSGFAELQLVLNVLMIVREVDLELDPDDYDLRIRYAPGLTYSGKMGFRIKGLRTS